MPARNNLLFLFLAILAVLVWAWSSHHRRQNPPGAQQPAVVEVQELPSRQPTVADNSEKGWERKVLEAMARNDLPTAGKQAKAGLTRFPNCVNLMFNCALIDSQLGNYEEALTYLDRVLAEQKGYFPNAHYLRGTIFEAQGDRERARTEFVAEVNKYPGSRRAWTKIKELGHEKR